MGLIYGPPAFTVHHQVAYPDVGEGSPHHHFVVTPPRTETVKVLRLDLPAHKVAARGAFLRDVACRRDMVCGKRISEDGQDPGSKDIVHRERLFRQIDEKRRLPYVGRCRVPFVKVPTGSVKSFPLRTSCKYAAVLIVEQVRVDRF